MKEDKPDSSSSGYLRRRPEELLARKKTRTLRKRTEEDVRAMAYELQVHQIQLEMQNKELKRARQELEESRSKYLELYEFSPIGYFTLDKQVRLKDELFQAQKLASVGKLAGGVAHNFNNLLTVVMGYASLLVAELKAGDPLREYAQKIINSSQIAAKPTQDLLAFSRKKPVNPQPVNMNGMIRDTEGILSQFLRENIELRTALSDEDCFVMADSHQIMHVLMNLATNARDAMPNGGSLKICTDIVEMDDAFIKAHGFGGTGKYVLISVSDTGVGMDESTRLRVFEPFFTTKEVGKGTGLGLASVYGIVKQHNGYIDVDSAPGKGTTFKIYLPHFKVKDT